MEIKNAETALPVEQVIDTRKGLKVKTLSKAGESKFSRTDLSRLSPAKYLGDERLL